VADERPTFTFCGRPFHVVESSEGVIDALGYPMWMRFAKAARGGVDAYSMEGAALVQEVLEASVHPEEWVEFERTATEHRCDPDTMWQALMDALEVIAQRPTRRLSDSSDEPTIPSAPPRSEEGSASAVVRELEAKGRPDLALVVVKAQEHLSA
jgi:hypothetical protein